jgi:hypothetical protein
MMTRGCFRIRPVFAPVARDFRDLDSYAAAWRSVLVGGLRAHKAAPSIPLHSTWSFSRTNRAKRRYFGCSISGMRVCVAVNHSSGASNDTELEKLKKRLQFVMCRMDCFAS